MKKLFFLLLGILLVVRSNGQRVQQNSFEIKQNVVKVVRTPWGLQLGAGPTKFYYDRKTEQYFGNHWSGDMKLAIYYENMSFSGGFRPMTVNVKEPLYFGGKELNELADLNVVKLDLMIGYNFNVLPMLSVEPYVGYLSTVFPVINQDVLNQVYNIPSARGASLGFNINKYFELSAFQYLVLSLNNNVGLSNYSYTHPMLGNSFYAISFGVAYKGWVTRNEY